MSKEVKSRRLILSDLFEYVKKNNVPMDSVILMRPEGDKVTLVDEIQGGTLTTDIEDKSLRFLMLTGFGADPLQKVTIQ